MSLIRVRRERRAAGQNEPRKSNLWRLIILLALVAIAFHLLNRYG